MVSNFVQFNILLFLRSVSTLEKTICTDCGGTLIEYYEAAGNGICIKCGTVVEENTIVSEVMFGETSAGAAMVQGSYVGQGSSKSPCSPFIDNSTKIFELAAHARISGPFGNRGSNESREQTIANGTLLLLFTSAD
jgi:transcription factor IIIB subunit 2